MTAAVSRQDRGSDNERERLVAQWLHHVDKLRAQLAIARGAGGSKLRFVMEAADVSRYVTITDGDGIVFAGLRVRIHGMDAPEFDQPCTGATGRPWPCGREAASALRTLLKCRRLEVEVLGIDVYGRLIARLHADGRDVAACMVAGGWAVARDRKTYGHLERQAARARRGIWRGAFEDPQSWRKALRQTSASGWPQSGQFGKTNGNIATGSTPRTARQSPASAPGADAVSRIQRMLDEVERTLGQIFENLQQNRH